MSRVNNLDTKAETPLEIFIKSLAELLPGQRVYCNNSKEEILKIRENLTRRRAEIPGADSHLEYVEALLLAEANKQLIFKNDT